MSIASTMSAQLRDVWTNGVYDNPVVAKELRTRMRGRKGFLVMGGYVLFLGVVLLISYYTMWIISANNVGGMQSLVNVKLGQKLFMALNWTQTILLAIIIPSLTSGALTLELEKKTIEMLVLTRLTPGTVILGKHLTGMLYSLILLMCSLPLSGICLMFGGISPAEVFITYVLLIAWTFLLSAVGVFWSSLFNRTAAAVLMTYGASMGYALSTAGSGAGMLQSLWSYSHTTDINALSLLNPGWAPWGAMLKANVCGLAVPLYLPPLVQHFSYGAALLFIAAMHVKYLKAEKALPARVLLIVGSLFTTWLMLGDGSYTHGMGASGLKTAITITAVSLFVTFGHLAPLLASGTMPVRQGLLTVASFLDPRKMFKSDLSGAFCFILLWVLLEFAVFGITLPWAAAAAHVKVTAATWASAYKIGAVVLTVVAAMAAVSIFASSVVKLRRNAVAITILLIILMFAGYGLILANHNWAVASHGRSANPVWQLAALWPVTPIIVEDGGWQANMPVLWWPPRMSWLVVSSAYALLTMALLLAAPKMARKFGGVQEEQY